MNYYIFLLQKFKVHYSESDFTDKESVETVNVTTGNDWCMVRSLEPNKAYMIKATGMTVGGDTIQSEVLHLKLIPKRKTLVTDIVFFLKINKPNVP